MVRARSLRYRWGVRRSSVLIAMAVVFLALLGGGAVLVLVLQSALASTSAQSAAARAVEIADLARTDGLDAALTEVRQDSRPAQLLQVVSPAHRVLAASRPGIATARLSTLAPASGRSQTMHIDLSDQDSTDDFLIVARGFTVDGQVYVVQVAAPLEVQAQTVRTVAGFLLLSTPVLLLVVGLAVWLLVGRALEPVEVIRRQVDRIDARQLSQRVDVPRTRDEIAALAATMNVMLDRLEASDRAQRSFVSDASHELRSPLSTVITAAEVAKADPTGAHRDERLDTILAESSRMRFLVDNLMTLAKADASGLDLQQVDVDLDDVVDAELRRLRSSSTHLVRGDVPPVRIVGDPRRLTQVLRNLLENADRHARSVIEVTLSVLPGPGPETAGEVVLRVDNDGAPIEPAMRERVFERFVRLDDSRSRDFGGSGLGLAISAEIVHAHGGTVVAGETTDGWCRFEVVLPLPRGAAAVLSPDSA